MAKLELKQQARELRLQGMSVKKIAKTLQVAASSVSLWVRDLPQPEHFTPEFRAKKRQARKELLKEARQKQARAKSDRLITAGGYWCIKTPDGYQGRTYIEGRYVPEHRYLMEQRLGRLLSSDEVVHHVNGNKLDNSPENLELMTQSDHTRHHQLERSRSEWLDFECTYCKKPFRRRKSYFGARGVPDQIACSNQCKHSLRKDL